MAEFVSIVGRLRRLVAPGGGTPEHPIAPPGEEVDPGYGVELPLGPSHPIELPEPPPGVWPPPTPSHPIVPIPPTKPGEEGKPGQLPSLPPGTIWPPPGKPDQPIALPPGKFAVLVIVPGYGYKYVIVDPSLKPTPKS